MLNLNGAKVKPVRFWSQKVLPLVYDDSLSYYEVLGKLGRKINEIIYYVTDNIKELIMPIIEELGMGVEYHASDESISLFITENEEE